MRYTKVVLNNHRVFRGEQIVEIPDGNGVVVIYGKNGKGKTSFLNAVRWVWTGKCKGRGGRLVERERLVNKLALADAMPGDAVQGSVTLHVQTDDHAWEVRRSITVKGQQVVEEVDVLRDRTALSAADAQDALAELMPPAVESFFLFDGELLDQYEKLVDEEPVSGSALREAIEQVLGIPLIVSAAKDVRAISDEAEKAIADAAKQVRETRALGQALEQAQDVARQYRLSAEDEDDRITALTTELREVEETLAAQSNNLALLGRRDQHRQRISELKQELADAKLVLQGLLGSSWKALLVDPLTATVERLDKEVEADRQMLQEQAVSLRLADLQRAVGSDHCPACASSLDGPAHAHLQELLAGADPEAYEAASERVQTGSERLKALRKLRDVGGRAALKVAEDEVLRLVGSLEAEDDDLREVDELLADAPADSLQGLVKRKIDLILKVERARTDFAKAEEGLRDQNNAIDRLRKQIQAKTQGGIGSDVAAERRQQLCAALGDLLEEAVSSYRDTLKTQVQERATDIFTAIRSEQDFAKLVINDQFGLRILGRDGQIVEDRSAGYEHLVALSLIGALQKCSPISGPVIMDTPFGRLDPEHVVGVLTQLDKLSHQAFVVVHEGELSPPTAREHLRGRLLLELELTRHDSSKHTLIRRLEQ